MPPKTKGGRKKKKEEPQPFRPEPADLDENETTYVWDRVAPSNPNPLSTAATLYTFATNQSVVATGPASSIVAGAASSCVPLLSPHPPSTPGHPHSQGTTGTGKRGGGTTTSATSPISQAHLNTIVAPTMADPRLSQGSSPTSRGDEAEEDDRSAIPTVTGAILLGDQPSYSGALPFVRHSGFFVATQPPRTTKEVQKQRAVYAVGLSERSWQETAEKLRVKGDDEEDIDGSIAAQRKQLEQDRRTLARDINTDEATLEANSANHRKVLEAQLHEYDMKQCGLEGSLAKLLAKRDMVVTSLQDRDLNRSQIKENKAKLDSLKKTHDTLRKKKEEELNADVEKLKIDMVNRLKKTMQDMEDLTMQHRERRQQRAVSESARLVSKLTSLEAKSKALTANNTKLGARVESTKRDQQLEQERHTLLAKKSQGLAQEIRELSAQLQKCEKLFSERTSATSQSQEVLTMSETIDRQYRVILELKSELDTVKSDTTNLSDKLKQVERAQFDALQSVAGGNSKAIVGRDMNQLQKDQVATAPNSPTTSNNPLLTQDASPQQDQSRIHGLVVKAVTDINQSMMEMSQGQRGIETVTDPKEQAELLGYIMKRVAMFQSGVFPTKPSVVQKSGPVGNLVSKSMSVTPRLLKGPADTPDSMVGYTGAQTARGMGGVASHSGRSSNSTHNMHHTLNTTSGLGSRPVPPSRLPTIKTHN